MGIIIVSFIVLIVLSIEHRIRIRPRYQMFSYKFSVFSMDFLILLISIGIGNALVFLLSLIHIPNFIIKYLLIFYFVYSLFIILPIKFFDEIMEKIFND
jgi:hypothetical protein